MQTSTVATFGTSNAAPKTEKVRLILPKDLSSKGIHYHMNHLRRLWNRGQFPRPVNISARKIAWDEAKIDAWIAEKLEGGE